jgi:transcriptional regulator with XRE-family HTH domain
MPLPFVAETFGDLLKYLRRRARLTQRELAVAVGYTEAHICRLEKNERLPDPATVAALFIPALYLEDEPELQQQLLKLAGEAHEMTPHPSRPPNHSPIDLQIEQEIGALECIPTPLPHYVARASMILRASTTLARERCVLLCGLPGMGKTTLAAAIARDFKSGPVFWLTLTAGLNTSVEAIIHQLALFLLANGQTQVKPLIENRAEGRPMPLDQQLILVRAALAEQTALLCFDDVHLLIDSEMGLSLLRHLIVTTRALLLLTSRQDVHLPGRQINLDGLEAEEAQDLIERLGVILDPQIEAALLTRTGRSPMLLRLAAVELLDTPADAATFVEHMETQPQVTLYLVNTVLQGLSPATQWMASLLSVFRQPLDLCNEPLIDLIEKSDLPCCLDDALSELQRHHLIDDLRSAKMHPLVQDHLYAMMAADPKHRKRLHSLAAEWLERAQGDVLEIGYHWLHAGDVEQAAEMISDQSELLFTQGRSQAAVQLVDEALECLRGQGGNSDNLRQRLLTARGDLLRGTTRSAEVEPAATPLATGPDYYLAYKQNQSS